MFFQIGWATSSMSVREKVTKMAVWVPRSWKGSSVWICWASQAKCKHLEADSIVFCGRTRIGNFILDPDPTCPCVKLFPNWRMSDMRGKLLACGGAHSSVRRLSIGLRSRNMIWNFQIVVHSQAPDDLNSGFTFTNRDLKLSDPGSQPPSYLNPGVVLANRDLKVSDRGSQTECPAT